MVAGITDKDFDGYDDMAYMRGRYHMEFIPEGSLKPVVDRGSFSEIRRKQNDGSWPISIDIWNPKQIQ